VPAEVGVDRPVVHGRGGAGPAGVLPLGLRRQGEPQAGPLLQEATVGHCPLPGDADRRLGVAVGQLPAPVLVLVVPADVAAVVRGVEPPVLGVGDLELAHPERAVDLHAGLRPLVRPARHVAHDELAGGDQRQRQLYAVAEADGHLGRLAVRAPEPAEGLLSAAPGLGGVERPARDAQQRRALRRRTRQDGLRRARPRGKDLLGVLGEPGVEFGHLQPPLVDVARDAAVLAPGAVVGHVQVDPRDQAVPGLGVKPNAPVALAEHLDQLAGIGVVLQRRRQVVIALGARPADVRVQGHVGRREAAPALLAAAEVRHRLAALSLRAVVAGDAVLVQHGLDLALEAEPARRAAPRADLVGLPRRQPIADRGGVRLLLVAADAGEHLAGHGRQPAPHDLQGLAVLVDRLEGDGRVGGHAEHRRSVRLDRHRAEDAVDVPGPVDADVDVPAHAVVGVVEREQPQPLDRAPRNALEARAGVDVRQVEDRVLPRQVDLVRDHGRGRRLPQGHGLQDGVARLGVELQHVVEHVDQVQVPRVSVGRLARDEEVLVAQRVGVQEPGPARVDQLVADDRLDLLAVAGDPLDDAAGLMASLGRVEEDQLAHARHAVVPADHRDDPRGVPRAGTGVEGRVRPVGVAAVQLHLLRAVGIHAE
jgi:hypothetical protein